MKETINDRVINLFKTLNLDEHEVANAISKHPTTINRILDKEHTPTKSTVKAIAGFANANFDYLWSGKGEMLKSSKSETNADNPWKDKAFQMIEQERDYFKDQYTKMVNALMSGNLGKLLALRNNAGTKLRKVA